MPLSTANSSFIFDRLRRSIRLCAVLRACFRPAVLDAEACFFFEPAAPAGSNVAVVASAVFEVVAVAAAAALAAASLEAAAFSALLTSCPRGFIWIILRVRVGGGGRAKASFWASLMVDARLRDLTASAACMGYCIAEGPLVCLCLSVEGSWLAIAGGGSSKASCREEICETPSLPVMSVDDEGVGGRLGRGIWLQV